jgi:hypothetical protein
MSVEAILAALAQQAGQRRPSLVGAAIADASQVPSQIMQDREQRRIQLQNEARQAEQLGFQRNADARATSDHSVQDLAAKTAQQEQQIAREVINAYTNGTPNDPTTNNLAAGQARARELGRGDWVMKLEQIDREQRLAKAGTITTHKPEDDVYRDGVLEKKGVQPLKTTTNDLALLAQNANPFVATLADKALTRAQRPAETHSSSYKEWQEYQKTGGTLGFDAYQTMDANRKRPVVHVSTNPSVPGGLDPDAVDYTATQYRILGASGIPTRLETADKQRIINAAAKQVKSLGQSPAQAIQKQFAFKSDAAALTKMTTMGAAAEAFETKAIAQADLVRSLSKKVSRADWTFANGVILSGKEAFGDTDAHLFANGLLTFTTEYAKLMEGSQGSAAGSSDTARREAAKLISTALKDGTIDKTLTQMQWEMAQTRRGYDVVIERITQNMNGGATPSGGRGGPPAAGPAIGTTRTANGETRRWNGQSWQLVQP